MTIYLPWPMVMDIADKLQANGYTQLAREARKTVWDEAKRLADRECYIKPDAGLSNQCLEQVGWHSDRVHREEGRTTVETISCMRFTEEGVSSDFVPVYRVRNAVCDVCNGTGLTYDRTECRMVPCGGICCVVGRSHGA